MRSLTRALHDRTGSSSAVDHASESSQRSAGPGATNLTNHLTATAAACPGTRFVLRGYPRPGACIRTSTRADVDAGRAERRLGVAYAIGSGDRLSRVSSYVRASVQQTGDGWERVPSC